MVLSRAERSRAAGSRRRANNKRAYKALGIRGRDELIHLINQPGRPVGSQRRFSSPLQVATFIWTVDRAGTPVSNTGGRVDLVSCYGYGSGDHERHSQRTVTYKMAFNMLTCWPTDDTSLNLVSMCTVYHWLVYDRSPDATTAEFGNAQIFDTGMNTMPSTWTVQRDKSRRFVVKKRWKYQLTHNGIDWRVPSQTVCSSAKQCVPWRKFVGKLNVATDWKDTATGGSVNDIKQGALYLCSAVEGVVNVVVFGRMRMYFKSIMGN
uniref:Capsid protein n=1 Tax=Yerba mate-associated circular DNA virus 1 TaxID=2219873 RepID=A0A2Z4ELG3_9VIRU|nr:putative capsid protein [Yerba mate-associated circular DNA virus 1]